MSQTINIYQGEDPGQWGWTIKDEQERLLADSVRYYASKQDCLVGLFSVFFGIYDNDNFMDLYTEWQRGLPKDQRMGAASDVATG